VILLVNNFEINFESFKMRRSNKDGVGSESQVGGAVGKSSSRSSSRRQRSASPGSNRRDTEGHSPRRQRDVVIGSGSGPLRQSSYESGSLHSLCEAQDWARVDKVLKNALNSRESSTSNHVGLQCVDKKGFHQRTPLLMCCLRAPSGTVELLVKCNPKCTLIPDRSGSLPLHFVSCWRRDSPFDDSARLEDDPTAMVITALLKASPSSVAIVNQYQQTALHCALDGKEWPSYLALRALLKLPLDSNDTVRDPYVLKALVTCDKLGRIPLHLACYRCAPLYVLELLVEACPRAPALCTNPTMFCLCIC